MSKLFYFGYWIIALAMHFSTDFDYFLCDFNGQNGGLLRK
jgi:hypothetical protein